MLRRLSLWMSSQNRKTRRITLIVSSGVYTYVYSTVFYMVAQKKRNGLLPTNIWMHLVSVCEVTSLEKNDTKISHFGSSPKAY